MDDIDAKKRLKATAAVLDQERYNQGLTYEELGRRSGMEKMTAHRYLKGSRDIPYSKLWDLCAALGVSVIDVITRAEDRAE